VHIASVLWIVSDHGSSIIVDLVSGSAVIAGSAHFDFSHSVCTVVLRLAANAVVRSKSTKMHTSDTKQSATDTALHFASLGFLHFIYVFLLYNAALSS